MTKTKYYLKTNHNVVLGIVKVNEENNVLYWNEVVDLLNSLSEKNEQLRKENDDFHKSIKEYEELKKEKRFKINTLETGYIYLDNPDGKHMSWIEVEDTLNSFYNENEYLKSEIIKVIDRKIKNNDSNPSQNWEVYSKVNKALKDVKENLRDVIAESEKSFRNK